MKGLAAFCCVTVVVLALAGCGKPNVREGEPQVAARTAPGKISGAVAVLPVEPCAMYDLPLTSNHVAAMEAQISEAIYSTHSLTLVDRQELDRVLAERRLAMVCGSAPASPGQIMAADVLIDSNILSQGNRTFLQVQAMHSITGSRLGLLRTSIDPATPDQFSPPLGKQVAEWWPGVMANLERARKLPIVAVFCSCPGARMWSEAETIKTAVQETIGDQPRCFLAEYRTSVNAQTEALMRVMGLSLACGGGLSPAVDYLAEVRILSDRKAQVRVMRSADRTIVAEGSVEAGSPDTLAAAAAKWFRLQANSYAAKPPAGSTRGEIDDWMKEQARREFQAAQQMDRELEEDIRSRAVRVGPGQTVSHLGEDDYRRRREALRRCMLAQQLDPTDEEIARWAVYAAEGVSADFLDRRLAGEIGDRYIASFPPSRSRDYVYEYALGAHNRLSELCRKAPQQQEGPYAPQALDCKRHDRIHLARAVEIGRLITDRMVRDWRPDLDAVTQRSYVTTFFQQKLAEYLCLVSAPGSAMDVAVNRWAQRYDRLPQIVPPSDFLRLRILADKQEKKAAAGLFVGLVRAHPDPRDKFWTLAPSLDGVDAILNMASQEWLQGQTKTADFLRVAEKRCEEISEE